MNKLPFDGLEWIEAGAPDTEEVTSSNLVTPTNFNGDGASNPCVAAFCFSYVSELVERGHIEHSTARAYGYLLKHVAEYFDGTGIRDVTPDALNGFVANLQDSGLAPGTVRKTYNLLAMALRHAHAARVIDWLPTLAVRAPKNRCPPPNPLTLESMRKLQTSLQALEVTPPVLAVMLALSTGMRRGEVCGLQWKDVATDYTTARVRRSIGVRDGGTYVKGTKTGNERTVPLAPSVARVMRSFRERMEDECTETGAPFRSSFYVLGKADGSYLSPYVLTRWWAFHAREWGLVGTQGKTPVFHDLRHTFATVAVRNLDPKTAQSIMGHSNINMTMKYADTEESQVRDASRLLPF